MTTTITDRTHDTRQEVNLRVNWGWLAAWVAITALTVMEVVEHGIGAGGTLTAVAYVATAVGAFIAPDLTFLVGIGESVPRGHMPPGAVPFYNAAHRLAVPATLTAVMAIGLGLGPSHTPLLLALVAGLSWMAHIALDRAAGYGLRNPDGSR